MVSLTFVAYTFFEFLNYVYDVHKLIKTKCIQIELTSDAAIMVHSEVCGEQ